MKSPRKKWSSEIEYYKYLKDQQEETLKSQKNDILNLAKSLQELNEERFKALSSLEEAKHFKANADLEFKRLNVEHSVLLDSYRNYQDFIQTHIEQLRKEIISISDHIILSNNQNQKVEQETEYLSKILPFFEDNMPKNGSPNLSISPKISTDIDHKEMKIIFRTRSTTSHENENFITDTKEWRRNSYSNTDPSKKNEENHTEFVELKKINNDLMNELYILYNKKPTSSKTDSTNLSEIKKSLKFDDLEVLVYQNEKNSELDKEEEIKANLLYINDEIIYNKYDMKIWTEEANFLANKKKSKALRERIQNKIKQFMPKSFRGKIWPFLIGNKNYISKELFQKLLLNRDVYSVPNKISQMIKDDLHRTFPKLQNFSPKSENNTAIQRILELFYIYRPDIGYVQGMAYIACLLFLHMNEYKTFKYFTNLILNTKMLNSFYSFKNDKICAYFETFSYFLSERNPQIIKVLEGFQIEIKFFLIEWFYTLFARIFPFEFLMKIWDLFFCYGEIIFIKLGLEIFNTFEEKILKGSHDEIIILIRNNIDEIPKEKLLKNVLGSKLTWEKWSEIYKKINENLKL